MNDEHLIADASVPVHVAGLAAWFDANGRHSVPWRSGRTLWETLVAEVMCCQTQLERVVEQVDGFLDVFPTPEAAAAAGQAAVLTQWGRLGYPRRAQALHRAAVQISEHGWPADLTELPGVGPWVAAATAAQALDADVFAFDVNIRRLAQRVTGTATSDKVLEGSFVPLLAPLRGRRRLLAALDLAAQVCTRRNPACTTCPLRDVCATRGPLDGEALPARQGRFAGSLRQRRGMVLDRLRRGPAPVGELDNEALASLVGDGLVCVDGTTAALA
jgi:A/G-specific adenine glycosylase